MYEGEKTKMSNNKSNNMKYYSLTIIILGSILITLFAFIGVIYACSNFTLVNGKVRLHDSLNIFLFIFSFMIVVTFLVFISNICLYFFPNAELKFKKIIVRPAFISKDTKNGILAGVFMYFLLILLFTIVLICFDYFNEFIQKTKEFEHYCNEYIVDEYPIKEYVENNYLKGNVYSLFEKNTMYNKDSHELTENFTKICASAKAGEINKCDFSKIIHVNDFNSILGYIVEHFYYSIQVISTLGFGNIVPASIGGMFITSLAVFLSQIYTIMLVGIIISTKVKNNNS